MLAYRVNYYSGILIYTLNIGVNYFTQGHLWERGVTWRVYRSADDHLCGRLVDGARLYFNNLDREISTDIRDGSIAIQFIRPYNYVLVKMMQGLGEGLFRFMMLMIPGMVIAILLFPVQLPTEPSAQPAFWSCSSSAS